MALESVTKAIEFHHAPAFPVGMFQVNAGVETSHVLGAASVIADYVRERLVDAVADGIEGDDAWVLSLLSDMAKALYRASGAEA